VDGVPVSCKLELELPRSTFSAVPLAFIIPTIVDISAESLNISAANDGELTCILRD
jgi:hypothetical protein